MSVNKVILVGNLGKDPEVHEFQNGDKVANFTVATSEHWKDKGSGEQRERTDWHNIRVTAKPLLRLTEQYLRKGSKVYLEGQLGTRKWQDQSGQDRYTTEVCLPPYRGVIKLLDSRPSAGSVDRRGPRDESQIVNGSQANGAAAVTQDFDDEIPF